MKSWIYESNELVRYRYLYETNVSYFAEIEGNSFQKTKELIISGVEWLFRVGLAYTSTVCWVEDIF